MKKCLNSVKYIGLTIIISIFFILINPHKSSESTERVKTAPDYIIQYLDTFSNLEYAEVLAIMQRESCGKPNLVVYENKVKDYSYGPMQVRGKTLRYLGFNGDFNEILNYEAGIYWGMKFLSICKETVTKDYLKTYNEINKHEIRRRTFATYNAGGVYWQDDNPNQYINHSYVRDCEWNYWRFVRYDKSYKEFK